MLCVWPGEWGHCEHKASPSLQSPRRLQRPQTSKEAPVLSLPHVVLHLAWGLVRWEINK